MRKPHRTETTRSKEAAPTHDSSSKSDTEDSAGGLFLVLLVRDVTAPRRKTRGPYPFACAKTSHRIDCCCTVHMYSTPYIEDVSGCAAFARISLIA